MRNRKRTFAAENTFSLGVAIFHIQRLYLIVLDFNAALEKRRTYDALLFKWLLEGVSGSQENVSLGDDISFSLPLS